MFLCLSVILVKNDSLVLNHRVNYNCTAEFMAQNYRLQTVFKSTTDSVEMCVINRS